MPVRSGRVVVDDGVELAILEGGTGPGLILVHGFSGAKEDFSDHLPALARTHHAIAFDHRGHGESGKPAETGAYSIGRMADDVVAVADASGLESFALLGVSLGGMVAQHVVLGAPSRVDALILMDTWPGPVPGIERRQVERAAAFVLEHGIEALWRAQAGRDPLATPAHERLLAERPGYGEYGDRKFLAQAPAMYAALVVELADRPDLSGELASVQCPTLVLAGEQDLLAVPGCEAIAGAIPGARLALVPDAGHSPQFENPVSWFNTVTGFFREVYR